jgi:hypothetical protein
MKVLSYLELCQLRLKEYDVYLWELQPLYEGIFPNHQKFYSQPFNPELITELFEGWEYIGINNIAESISGKEFKCNNIYNYILIV